MPAPLAVSRLVWLMSAQPVASSAAAASAAMAGRKVKVLFIRKLLGSVPPRPVWRGVGEVLRRPAAPAIGEHPRTPSDMSDPGFIPQPRC